MPTESSQEVKLEEDIHSRQFRTTDCVLNLCGCVYLLCAEVHWNALRVHVLVRAFQGRFPPTSM